MDNVTFTHSVLRKHTIDPLEGHTVVVFEQIGDAGEKFRFEIEPEHEPQKAGLFRLPWRAQPNYFAYAVPTASLQAQFGADIRMDDLLHAFVMKIGVTFSVSEPRLVATRRNDDPLKIVRDEIVRLVQKCIAPYRWIDVTNNFRRVEGEVISEVLAAVRHLASGCGLRVQDLSLSHDVPRDQIPGIVAEDEHTTAKDRIQKEAELEVLRQELKIQQQDLEAKRAAFRRSMEIADVGVRTLTTALQNAANAVHNPGELMQTLMSVNHAIHDILDGGPRFASTALPGGGPAGFLDSGNPSQTGLAPVLVGIVAKTEQVLPGPAKKRLQAALLHLVAELLPEETADETTVKQYVDRVIEVGSEATLSSTQSDFLREHINTRALRERLH